MNNPLWSFTGRLLPRLLTFRLFPVCEKRRCKGNCLNDLAKDGRWRITGLLAECCLHGLLSFQASVLREGGRWAGKSPTVSATVISRGLSPSRWDYSFFPLSSRLPPTRITTCLVADRLRVGACTMTHDVQKNYKLVSFLGPQTNRNFGKIILSL